MNENMNNMERGARISLGMAVMLSLLHYGINNGVVFPIAMIASTIVALTGLTGWDPLYAILKPEAGKKVKKYRTSSQAVYNSM